MYGTGVTIGPCNDSSPGTIFRLEERGFLVYTREETLPKQQRTKVVRTQEVGVILHPTEVETSDLHPTLRLDREYLLGPRLGVPRRPTLEETTPLPPQLKGLPRDLSLTTYVHSVLVRLLGKGVH